MANAMGLMERGRRRDDVDAGRATDGMDRGRAIQRRMGRAIQRRGAGAFPRADTIIDAQPLAGADGIIDWITAHTIHWQVMFGAPRLNTHSLQAAIDGAISDCFQSPDLKVHAGAWTFDIHFRMSGEYGTGSRDTGTWGGQLGSERSASSSHERGTENATSAEVGLEAGDKGGPGAKLGHESKDIDTRRQEHGSKASVNTEEHQQLARAGGAASVVADIYVTCDWTTMESLGWESELIGAPPVPQNHHQEIDLRNIPNVASIRFWRNTDLAGGE